MCVILSKKISSPEENLDEKKFNLFKIRDRSYDVKYDVKTITYKNGISVLYIIDNHSEWTEGINSNNIMIVSSALENHFDEIGEKPPKEYKDFLKQMNKRNGVILRRALRQETLDKVKEVLTETLFIGNTLISDGNRCYSLEIAIPKEKFDFDSSIDIEDEEISFHDFKIRVMKTIDPEDFIVSVKEITDDLYVKTNHSIDVNGLGYSKDDKGYESSEKRRNIIIKELEDFEGGALEIMKLLNNMDSESFSKNPELRPKRIKGKINISNKEKEKSNISDYYSTDIFGLLSDGTLLILPIHSKIKNINIEKIRKKTGINLFILKGNDNESLIKKAYNKIKEM